MLQFGVSVGVLGMGWFLQLLSIWLFFQNEWSLLIFVFFLKFLILQPIFCSVQSVIVKAENNISENFPAVLGTGGTVLGWLFLSFSLAQLPACTAGKRAGGPCPIRDLLQNCYPLHVFSLFFLREFFSPFTFLILHLSHSISLFLFHCPSFNLSLFT